MPQKRVLVYSTQYMPTGGIESHLLEFCCKMAQKDIAIDLVIPNARMKAETKVSFEESCRKVYLLQSDSSLVRTIFLLYSSIRMLFNQYTALYTNGQGESISLFAKLFRFGNWVHHHHTSGDAADQATWGRAYRRALSKADTVIACSQKNAGLMRAVLHRTIDVIPAFSRKVVIDKAQPFNDPLRFGYYGRLIPEKGIDIICKLSEEATLQNVHFHIWGEGEAYTASFFDKYPNVFYNGTFSGLKDLTKVISFMDAYLLLSVHPEGLPISLLEVMSAGVPWLATDKGGIPDIAIDPVSTRVIPATAGYDQMKKAIQVFVRDIREGKVSGTMQKKLYEATFSSEALIIQWENVLQLN